MGFFNKVVLMGNLTRDPEVRSTQSGQVVTALGMAINRTFTVGGPGGEKREEVAFVDVDFWGRRGEIIAQYFKRGQPILIEGRLTYRQWEAKDGGKRNKLTVTGENFEFVGSRQDSGAGASGGGAQGGGAPGGGAPGGGFQDAGPGGYAGAGGGGGGGGGGQDVSSGAENQGFDEVPF